MTETTTQRTAGSYTGPGYFDLRALAEYTSCSVRWLRDRLVDRAHPLPYHRVGGKILVKRADFDSWLAAFRIDRSADELDEVVNGVLAQMSS